MEPSASPFTYSQASLLLQKAGLSLAQVPKAWRVLHETADQWLQQKIDDDIMQQITQLLKSQLQEHAPRLVVDQLQEVMIRKLVLRLGIRSAMAGNIVTLLLPYLLEKAWKQAQQNPQLQAWWHHQTWSEKIPSKDTLHQKWNEVCLRFRKKLSQEPGQLFL